MVRSRCKASRVLLAILYLESERELVGSHEGWIELRHLVHNDAQRPDVTLFVVLLAVALLWTHVVGAAKVGLSIVVDAFTFRITTSDSLSEAEVTKLGVLLLV